MTGIEQVRLAIAAHKGETFVTLDFKGINNLSARMNDLVLSGELEIVGEMKVDKRKPFKIYKKAKIKQLKKAQQEPVKPIKGLTLRQVKWDDASDAWKETVHPCYDGIPVPPMLADLIKGELQCRQALIM